MPAPARGLACVCLDLRRRTTLDPPVSVPTAELTHPSVAARLRIPPRTSDATPLGDARFYVAARGRRAGDRGAVAADPVDPELRPVGVARVGPGDHPPQPAHDGRPDMEAAADDLHDAVRAVRQGGARHVARGRARRRRDGGGDGVQDAARLTWWLGDLAGLERRLRASERIAALAPGCSPARSRALGLVFSGAFITDNALRLLRGADDRARADRTRPPPRRPPAPGVRVRLLRGARPPGDLGLLGSYGLWLLWKDPGRAQARRWGCSC